MKDARFIIVLSTLILFSVSVASLVSEKSHRTVAHTAKSVPVIPTVLPSRIPSITQPIPSPTVVIVKHFSTLPPASILPSGEACAARVRRNIWEPRPENYTANHTIPSAGSDYAIIDWGPNSFGQNEKANTLRARINGSFVGTTDEILQWAACKWGIDEDIVRAQAVQESYWRMSQLGDHTESGEECAKFGASAPCDQSYGILQVKASVHRTTFPAARNSTAFNADYTYAFWRSCYEGYIDWLHAEHPEYKGGDVWGCLGHWASGTWYNDDANTYINTVKEHLNTRRWEQSDF